MDSPGDTEPELLTWESVRHFPNIGDFARLIPTSYLARLNFSRLAARLENDMALYPYARRFIYYEPMAPPDETSATDGSFADGAREEDREAVQASFCGFYRLNMNLPPCASNLGWVVGSNRASLPENSVDLALTPFPGMNGVRGRHCRLQRDLESGILVLKSDCRKVLVDGKYELKRDLNRPDQPPQEYQRALHGPTGITVGDLSYVIEFTDLPRSVQEQELSQARGFQQSTAVYMSPTPAQELQSFHGYAVHPVTHGGATSTVSYGFSHATAQPVVLKKVKRDSRTFHMLEKEIKLLRSLNHENIYKLIEVIDQSGRRNPKDFKHTECDEVTLVLAPAAPAMLSAVTETWRHIAKEPQMFLRHCIQQVASGLAYMHNAGVIHHDIKPDNIALVSMAPVKVVIIDLGHAEAHRQSTNHRLGTIRYLAPEVMLLKMAPSAEPFSFPVDVWSLGVTALELLGGRRISWDTGLERNRNKLNDLLGQHHTSNLTPFRLLASKMLTWSPENRITASAINSCLKERFKADHNNTSGPLVPSKRRKT